MGKHGDVAVEADAPPVGVLSGRTLDEGKERTDLGALKRTRRTERARGPADT